MSRTCRVSRKWTNRIALVSVVLGLGCSLAWGSEPTRTPLNPALVAARWHALPRPQVTAKDCHAVAVVDLLLQRCGPAPIDGDNG